MAKKLPAPVSDPNPQPPEELRALCALCDVKVKFIAGRPGNAWELYVNTRRGRFGRILQSVEYDAWNDIVKWLVEQRDAG